MLAISVKEELDVEVTESCLGGGSGEWWGQSVVLRGHPLSNERHWETTSFPGPLLETKDKVDFHGLSTLHASCLLPTEVTCEKKRLCNLSHCFPPWNTELPHQPCLFLSEEVFATQQQKLIIEIL